MAWCYVGWTSILSEGQNTAKDWWYSKRRPSVCVSIKGQPYIFLSTKSCCSSKWSYVTSQQSIDFIFFFRNFRNDQKKQKPEIKLQLEFQIDININSNILIKTNHKCVISIRRSWLCTLELLFICFVFVEAHRYFNTCFIFFLFLPFLQWQQFIFHNKSLPSSVCACVCVLHPSGILVSPVDWICGSVTWFNEL